MGTLSVRENLMFSGHLRLPRHQYSTADKEKKVTSVIQELGLEDCADTKVKSVHHLSECSVSISCTLFFCCCQIGTEFLRGVSGGERKRCSIGMELITSPSLLFLDEPTTGLDSNTANSIMALLHRYQNIRCGKTSASTRRMLAYCLSPSFSQIVPQWQDDCFLHPPAALFHLQTL